MAGKKYTVGMEAQVESNEQGMVSLMTVTLIAIILTIITTGFLRIIARSQRLAIDKQLSAQAYYAAETGIEDAKKAIKVHKSGVVVPKIQNILNGQPDTCAPATWPGGPTAANGEIGENTRYTCQLIDPTPTELEYDIGVNESKLAIIRMPTVPASANFTTIRVTWREYTGQGLLSPLPNTSNIKDLPAASDWPLNTLAMMRLEFMTIKPTNSTQSPDCSGVCLSRDQFYRNDRIHFVQPRDVGTSVLNLKMCREIESPAIDSCSLDTQYNDGVEGATCSANECTVQMNLTTPNGTTIGGFSDYPIGASNISMLRIRPLYNKAHVKVEVINNNGVKQKIANSQTVIDVTARADQVYKRVRVRVPPANNPFPDYAVNVAEDLCKLFKVTPGAVASECPTP
jgi:hypothetical protein